jgi:hypothetical protein
MTPAAEPPLRGTLATLALLGGFLFGGMAIGLGIAVTVGGGSEGAVAVGFFTLPLAFGLGMAAWRSVLGAWLVAGLGRALLRSGGDEAAFREETKRSLRAVRDTGPAGLPGTWVFVPVATAVGAIGGLLMWVVASGNGPLAATLLVAAAIADGILLRRLARRGLLPIPEE